MLNSLPEVSFFVVLFLGAYSYCIYPLILLSMRSRFTAKDANAGLVGEDWPSLTVIVTAHNEASRIREKLDNLLGLPAYPGKVEMLVASDASTDGTDEAVLEYESRGVRLVRNPVREGKEAAQALAIGAASGAIIVFSDVSTTMRGDVLSRIAKWFADPRVGAISSRDEFLSRDGQPSGEGAYVRYEMFLRRQESRVNSLVGLSGSFFAATREVCRERWSRDVPSDFMTAVNCVRLGLTAKHADDVVGYYPDLADSSQEYRRKVRTVLRGMRALLAAPDVLNPLRYGFFSFQLWSHKIARWGAPWLLLALLPLNLLLVGRGALFMAILVAQLVFYSCVSLGALSSRSRGAAGVRIPYYFALANLAVMHAALELVRGRTAVVWKPSER